MNEQAAYAIPKDRQNVTVLLISGGQLEGTIFLEHLTEAVTLHHKVVDFLEDGTAFFPLRLDAGGKTEFINKNNFKLIELVRTAEMDQEIAPGLMQHFSITVVFNDGSTLGGDLSAEVPMEKARLSDCLNLPSQYLHVKTDRTVCYVNKHAVLKVMHTPDE